MNIRFKFPLILLCMTVAVSIQAQTGNTIDAIVKETFAVKHGTTKPIKELVAKASTNRDKKSLQKSMVRPPNNFIGRELNKSLNRPELSKMRDTVIQKSFLKSNGLPIEPIVNRDGITTLGSPHDPSGDVGKDYYVLGINVTDFAVYDKNTGELVGEFAGNTLWNEIGFSSGGDPIILYDREYEKWIITEFPSPFSANSNRLLVAVSLTSDPMGAYDAYSFATPSFPDYPKYGIWDNAITVTTNEQGPSILDSYFIRRDELMNGAEEVTIQSVGIPGTTQSENGFFVATPVDWNGVIAPPEDRHPLIVRLADASWSNTQMDDQIEIYSIDLNWDNPDSTEVSQVSVPVSPYDANPCSFFGFACVPQLNGNGVDAIPEVIMNQIHYRNYGSHESMLMNFITDVTDGDNVSGVRWIEMRRTESEDWSLYQEGTIGPDDGKQRFMGSLALDGVGNIGVAYNFSSEDDYVGVRATGRRVGDPLGQMTFDETIIVEGSGVAPSAAQPGRFGDYSHMVIDQYDDKTFWYTTEYGATDGTRTRIFSFQLGKDTVDIGPFNLKTPVTSAQLTDSEEVFISVRNFGIDTVQNFEVGYILDNGMAIIESVDSILPPDSIYDHTFQMTADLSSLGTYEFKLFTSLETDLAIGNDTLVISVQNLAQFDGALTELVNLGDVVCGDSTSLALSIDNRGVEVIDSIDVDLSINGQFVRTERIREVIGVGSSINYQFEIAGLQNGLNDVSAEINVINEGFADQINIDDQASTSVSAIIGGEIATLNLQSDNFPNETSWEITDLQGNLVASGGPYVGDEAIEIIEDFCIDPDSCYIMTIRDSYGDGITFNGVAGDYQIISQEGDTLATLLNAAFGMEESNEFCATFNCSVAATSMMLPASVMGASDGMLIITPTDGIGPFRYSIDGGVNFQESNVFDDLSAGEYTIIVQGTNDCSFELTAEVIECTIDVAVEISPESDIDANDAVVTVTVTNANGNVRYSLDNGTGVTSTSNNVFSNLTTGEYVLSVSDSLGCETEIDFHIGNLTSTEEQIVGTAIKIYPNPTPDIVRIEAVGLSQEIIQIPLRVYDQSGRMVTDAILSKYNDQHIGVFSLHAYPSGTYYMQIVDPHQKTLIPVIKE